MKLNILYQHETSWSLKDIYTDCTGVIYESSLEAKQRYADGFRRPINVMYSKNI